jgi:hypothetical protein
VVDVFVQRIVGWHAMVTRPAELVLIPLRMAAWARGQDGHLWSAGSSSITPMPARRADSTGRRNTFTVRSCDGSTETAVGHGGPVTDAFAWSAAGGAA